ncbi:hypothetical protein DN069_24485 [Streptacidiphilus pinicola]|uniref:Uncharacterized protein n=1 Tax=Streptacidiphilus pinicola TaxID=2219663 RepID=A0A2X0IDF5_9ACTN|nr:hypothetical protein [Streptacidiphilus pinicola]RAG83032.1 hypothetical protein DN069_24485 [Streptacidiphilus pinicola]
MTAQQTSHTPGMPEADRPELSSALHHAAERAAAPPLDLDHLVGRVRRKRRSRAGLVGALALAVLAAGGVAVPRLLSASPGPADHGHHGKQQQKLTVQQVDAQRMVAALQSVLPPGGRVSAAKGEGLGNQAAPGVPSTGAYVANAGLIYDDGHGAGWVDVVADRWDGPDSSGMPQGCDSDSQVEHCHSVALPGGGVLRLVQLILMDLRNPVRQWDAELFLPSGGMLSLRAVNATVPNAGPPTRQDPPLTLAQLRAAATAPVWQPILAAVPKQTKIVMNVPGVNTVLAASIPAGFAKTPVMMAHNVMMGVTTVLTDNQGKGSVFAQAETEGDPASTLLGQFRHQYPGAVNLSDGDWLVTFQKPGQNWAVLLHGELRIQIVALDSVDLAGPRTRPTPVLTPAQCAAIARNPQWRLVP